MVNFARNLLLVTLMFSFFLSSSSGLAYSEFKKNSRESIVPKISDERVIYYLSFKKKSKKVISVFSCVAELGNKNGQKLEPLKYCNFLKDIPNKKFSTLGRKLAVPAIAAFDGFVIVVAFEVVGITTIIPGALQIIGMGWLIGKTRHLSPRFQWKKASLLGLINDLSFKSDSNKETAVKELYYTSEEDLLYAEDIILSIKF